MFMAQEKGQMYITSASAFKFEDKTSQVLYLALDSIGPLNQINK